MGAAAGLGSYCSRVARRTPKARARAAVEGLTGVARQVRERVRSIDWARVGEQLDTDGHARIPRLLTARDCAQLSRLYAVDGSFRSRVSMEQHRFGAGEYRYFAYPLPALVAALRDELYPPLAEIANRWAAMLGEKTSYPDSLQEFLTDCHARGQARPTPLLLHYTAGGYNCLHQDLYGAVAFPLQVACLLSAPQRDFEGGEFLLVEQRPRMQSRGEAIALSRGEAIVFPNTARPVAGARGSYRAKLRHGVSRVRAGERLTLGIIFHDAQ